MNAKTLSRTEAGKREYVYYHPGAHELITLFEPPVDGHEVYDLAIEGNVVLTDLHYIGEL